MRLGNSHPLLPLPLVLALVGFCETTAARAQWTDIGPDGGYLEALAINPSEPSTIYAGAYGGGVFKSTNGGASWAPSNSGLTATTVLSLAINPSDPNTIYAGTYGGGVSKGTNAWSHAGDLLDNPDSEIDPAE